MLFYCCGGRGFCGVCHPEVCSDYVTGSRTDRSRNMYHVKKMNRGDCMKIVVVKAPKFFKGILKSIFRIKNDE